MKKQILLASIAGLALGLGNPIVAKQTLKENTKLRWLKLKARITGTKAVLKDFLHIGNKYDEKKLSELQQDLETTISRIEKIKDEKQKNKLLKSYEKTKKQVDDAKKLDEPIHILAEHYNVKIYQMTDRIIEYKPSDWPSSTTEEAIESYTKQLNELKATQKKANKLAKKIKGLINKADKNMRAIKKTIAKKEKKEEEKRKRKEKKETKKAKKKNK